MSVLADTFVGAKPLSFKDSPHRSHFNLLSPGDHRFLRLSCISVQFASTVTFPPLSRLDTNLNSIPTTGTNCGLAHTATKLANKQH